MLVDLFIYVRNIPKRRSETTIEKKGMGQVWGIKYSKKSPPLGNFKELYISTENTEDKSRVFWASKVKIQVFW